MSSAITMLLMHKCLFYAWPLEHIVNQANFHPIRVDKMTSCDASQPIIDQLTGSYLGVYGQCQNHHTDDAFYTLGYK